MLIDLISCVIDIEGCKHLCCRSYRLQGSMHTPDARVELKGLEGCHDGKKVKAPSTLRSSYEAAVQCLQRLARWEFGVSRSPAQARLQG